jgi:hypothetical protein
MKLDKFSYKNLMKVQNEQIEARKNPAVYAYDELVRRACAIALWHNILEPSDSRDVKRIEDGEYDLICQVSYACICEFNDVGQVLLVNGFTAYGGSLHDLFAPLDKIQELDAVTPEDAPCPQTIDPDLCELLMRID